VLTSKIGPYVGKRLLETGKEIIEDVKSGSSVGSAIKRNVKKSFKKEKENVIRKLTGARIKRKRKTIKKKRKSIKKRKPDIFS